MRRRNGLCAQQQARKRLGVGKGTRARIETRNCQFGIGDICRDVR